MKKFLAKVETIFGTIENLCKIILSSRMAILGTLVIPKAVLSYSRKLLSHLKIENKRGLSGSLISLGHSWLSVLLSVN